jgi:hypothetical protein
MVHMPHAGRGPVPPMGDLPEALARPASHAGRMQRPGCFATNWFGLEACEGVAAAPAGDDVAGRIEVLAAAVVALARSVEAVLARLDADAGADAVAVPVAIRRPVEHQERCRRLAG